MRPTLDLNKDTYSKYAKSSHLIRHCSDFALTEVYQWSISEATAMLFVTWAVRAHWDLNQQSELG